MAPLNWTTCSMRMLVGPSVYINHYFFINVNLEEDELQQSEQ